MKRRDVPTVTRQIQGRSPQPLDAFIYDCGLAPGDRVRRIAEAVRRSLTIAATFAGDRLRANDSYPGTMEVLPGWDSVDFLEWLLVFEDCLGETVPEGTFDDLAGTITVADLVNAATNSTLLRSDADANVD